MILVVSFAAAAGCNRGAVPPAASRAASTVDGSKYLLTAEPHGAEDVIQVRQTAGDEQDIVVVGRIGDSGHPWVDGRAAGLAHRRFRLDHARLVEVNVAASPPKSVV
jgi:hypothetical protein